MGTQHMYRREGDGTKKAKENGDIQSIVYRPPYDMRRDACAEHGEEVVDASRAQAITVAGL
jgi:hypothetical protein